MATIVIRLEERKEQYLCNVCGRNHDVLYVIHRKTGVQFGHFMAFMINGDYRVIDPTLPQQVERIPRDALKVPQDIADATWHSTGHYCELTDGKQYYSYDSIRRLLSATQTG